MLQAGVLPSEAVLVVVYVWEGDPHHIAYHVNVSRPAVGRESALAPRTKACEMTTEGDRNDENGSQSIDDYYHYRRFYSD